MIDARECLHNLLAILDAAGVHLLDFASLDELQRHMSGNTSTLRFFPS